MTEGAGKPPRRRMAAGLVNGLQPGLKKRSCFAMGLFNLFNLFSEDWREHHRHRHGHHHGRGFQRNLSRAYGESPAWDQEPGKAKVCPLCKNHCSLSSPQCERGRLYAEGL